MSLRFVMAISIKLCKRHNPCIRMQACMFSLPNEPGHTVAILALSSQSTRMSAFNASAWHFSMFHQSVQVRSNCAISSQNKGQIKMLKLVIRSALSATSRNTRGILSKNEAIVNRFHLAQYCSSSTQSIEITDILKFFNTADKQQFVR